MMKKNRKITLFVLLACCFVTSSALTKPVSFHRSVKGEMRVYSLENDKISCKVVVESGRIKSETLSSEPNWAASHGNKPVTFTSDGDFRIDLMWTDWGAPKRLHNGDNEIELSKDDFILSRSNTKNVKGGVKEMNLFFDGRDIPLEVKLTYRLAKGDFFVRRKIAVRDKTDKTHFLRWLWPREGSLKDKVEVIKPGGFGQPIAILKQDGGVFMGLEYPTAENHIRKKNGKHHLRCGQEMGLRIGESWIGGEWVVSGVSPDSHIKLWFKKYLDTIRVSKLRPYLLYNTWYDVRSKIYTDRPEDVMNEKNLLRIIEDFKREMVEKRGIKLDAFVLDDAWDIYESDWELRKVEFPRGLKPISKALKKMGADLGIWFGPTGGYSYRMKRINWMKKHGYEVVGTETSYNKAMLCLAGKKYKELFKKRVVDFTAGSDVGYFKWDGIQFSCSEPDHGHPTGIYSRRAVMESLIDISNGVRKENKDAFLNITSGTWLSPWWTKYANQIWMQGQDYGYSRVPSISKRDAAMTYRDFVLYENYGLNDHWFPISNLMTHGIIKGQLQKLGGEKEPLDKFTDNAVLYFARGVSMWELYVTPTLLSDGEWNAIAKSVKWAKDRFSILKQTEMVGGNPGEMEPYGYAHYLGKEGIIAVRNPSIEPRDMEIELEPSHGLDASADQLILERTYPAHWVSTRQFKAGDKIKIRLQGYETAVYELYPSRKDSGRSRSNTPGIKAAASGSRHEKVKDGLELDFQLSDTVVQADLAILLSPDEASENINFTPDLFLDGKKTSPGINGQTDGYGKEKGGWKWLEVPVGKGSHKARLSVGSKGKKWRGKVSIWLICDQRAPDSQTDLKKTGRTNLRPALPRPYPDGIVRKNIKLGESTFNGGVFYEVK